MVDIKVVIVDFSPLDDCRVYVWGEHYGVQGCIVESVDGEGAFVRVQRRVGLSFAVNEL